MNQTNAFIGNRLISGLLVNLPRLAVFLGTAAAISALFAYWLSCVQYPSWPFALSQFFRHDAVLFQVCAGVVGLVVLGLMRLTGAPGSREPLTPLGILRGAFNYALIVVPLTALLFVKACGDVVRSDAQAVTTLFAAIRPLQEAAQREQRCGAAVKAVDAFDVTSLLSANARVVAEGQLFVAGCIGQATYVARVKPVIKSAQTLEPVSAWTPLTAPARNAMLRSITPSTFDWCTLQRQRAARIQGVSPEAADTCALTAASDTVSAPFR